MKTLSLGIALATSVAALAAVARADVAIIDNDKTIAVDCTKDPEVHLLGNHLTVTASGVCTRITVEGNHETVTGSATTVRVAGNHNTLTLAAADDVTVDGNNNTVVVRKPIKLKAPRISNTGTDNHITAK
jgi:catabolite regulation protein CreA